MVETKRQVVWLPLRLLDWQKKAMKILRAIGMGLAIIILATLMGDAFSAFSQALVATFKFEEHAMRVGEKALDAASPMLK